MMSGYLTRAGRAFAKKVGKLFPPVPGGPQTQNEAGQTVLEDILTNPATMQGVPQGGNFVGGKTFVGPNGIGAVFDSSGTLQYFGKF